MTMAARARSKNSNPKLPLFVREKVEPKTVNAKSKIGLHLAMENVGG